jgi:hypothetical protein
VVLQPGDVFTYTFTNLPQVVPGAGVSEVPVGTFTVSVSSFDAVSDVLFVEMFENGTNEAPLLTFVQEAANDGSSFPNAWADFQGTVRLTMLSGSVTLESLLFAHEVQTGPSTWERHQLAVVPVRGASLLEQLVPCAGPRSGGTWKNHGQYVSAIAKTAKDLVRQGLLTQQERSAAVQEAAHSGCGKQSKKPKKPKKPKD